MRTINIERAGKVVSTIHFADNISNIATIVDRPVFIVCDTAVATHTEHIRQSLGSLIKGILPLHNISEHTKTFSTVETICRWLLNSGADRDATLIAIGGGIVTDMAGFAASIYKRGISTIYIPTTLLAQVDAAIGGKTGANLDSYKNIIGTFHQPRHTFICPEVLETLPSPISRDGLAEMLKTFIIDNSLSPSGNGYSSEERVSKSTPSGNANSSEEHVSKPTPSGNANSSAEEVAPKPTPPGNANSSAEEGASEPAPSGDVYSACGQGRFGEKAQRSEEGAPKPTPPGNANSSAEEGASEPAPSGDVYSACGQGRFGEKARRSDEGAVGKMMEVVAGIRQAGSFAAASPQLKADFGRLVEKAATVKAGIVSRDEREGGERRKLNLGHTFGHAIEHCAGQAAATTNASQTAPVISHGEAVAIGMAMAAHLSVAMGITDPATETRILDAITACDLPTACPFPLDTLADAMQKDKKAENGKVHFILIRDIGDVIVRDLPVTDALARLTHKQ